MNRIESVESNLGEASGSEKSQTAMDQCPFCELFISEVENGKAREKDAQMFSSHMETGEHF
jgi:hypothetical protein